MSIKQKSRQIAFVTCQTLAELTPDDQALIAPLARYGFEVVPAIWDDATVDWKSFEKVIIRSTWDYYHHAAAFAAWVERMEAEGVNLWNPLQVVRWNMHKKYLHEMAQHGVPILPSVWLHQGEAANLAEIMTTQHWQTAVIKPSISASASNTSKCTWPVAEAEQAVLDALLQEGDVIVQEFAPKISEGEWSLVFFGEVYRYAFLKKPAPDNFYVQGHRGGTSAIATPPQTFIEAARRMLQTAWQITHSTTLYARVDGVEHAGQLCLMELELIEPGLSFASLDADTLDQCALAIAER